jgi:hypothetical protein
MYVYIYIYIYIYVALDEYSKIVRNWRCYLVVHYELPSA